MLRAFKVSRWEYLLLPRRRRGMSDDELGDLDWLTWEWIEKLAQSGSDNPEDGDCWISEPTKAGDDNDE